MQRITWAGRWGHWRRLSRAGTFRHPLTLSNPQLQRRWKGVVPEEPEKKTAVQQPKEEDEVADPTTMELFPESENLTWKTFEPPTSLLTGECAVL